MDKDKVIKELEEISDYFFDIYRNEKNGYSPAQEYCNAAEDAITLLKEQDAKPDKCIICEGCGHKLQDDWNWCPWCRWETARGRRVKLDGF